MINTTADRGDDLNNQETRSLITTSDTFSLIGRLYDVNPSASHLGAKDEYLRYLQLVEIECSNNVANILEWWKMMSTTFPSVSHMARDILAIQGSSAESERLFSSAALFLTSKRNRLQSEKLTSLLCLNSWHEYYKSLDIK